MNLEDLVSPATLKTIADHGLHKVAGAMHGAPEMDIGIAVRSIGERAYLRRKEARAIADGIVAFAAVTGEKIAENPALMALLRRSVAPAAMGAGIAAVPHLMSNDPNQGSMLPSMGVGALLGGAGGGIHALNAATKGPLNPHLAQAIQALP